MSKREPVDFKALTQLTVDQAAPMPEAVQRMSSKEKPGRGATSVSKPAEPVKTAYLEALAFKVPPAFRIRFRQGAAGANLKLNELLFECLDAWEEKNGLK